MSSSEAIKKEKNGSKAGRLLNSAMAFVIAYTAILSLLCLSTALAGRIFGLDPQIYFYGVRFALGRHHWTTTNAFWVWSSGTIIITLVGVICSRLYIYLRGRLILVNLVLLWVAIIAYAVAAAQTLLPLLSGYDETSPFYTNLAIAFNFAGVPVWALYIICLTAFLLLVAGTAGTARSFLSFAYSFSKVNRRSRRRKYYTETVLLPFLLGAAIVFLFFRQTYQFYNFNVQNLLYLIVIAVVLLLALLLSGMSEVSQDDVLRYKNLQQLNAALFVVMMVFFMLLAVGYQGFYLPF
ncbi:MAG: hypothetical protein JST83_02385 [Bacteroidetes bacterium]|nr:hypothetical protein [Bacteroidota bacterium]